MNQVWSGFVSSLVSLRRGEREAKCVPTEPVQRAALHSFFSEERSGSLVASTRGSLCGEFCELLLHQTRSSAKLAVTLGVVL